MDRTRDCGSRDRGSIPLEGVMTSILDASIENIKYFNPAAVKKLVKLKIKTIHDLLYHFPYRYEDFSEFTPIKDVKPNE
ncbi:MAG: hypothetical protein UV48_C0024G0006 [Candidatus Azambacteria bacterium GW2011_GWA2_42_9]|uniref:RecG wedge domain-containing protein n=1 Tax=Candidatus Azambacteria bacterium GW2011_GWA2_42_9 TaxID=1618613 RepID=A0A0G1BNF0_9BACT|nr:MAG: hypothetical protein UV48_C0024G0006 [Candidatus Azambacteria bacterium GW2011_GWA2_42_9]